MLNFIPLTLEAIGILLFGVEPPADARPQDKG
jgi:hypothetical protein